MLRQTAASFAGALLILTAGSGALAQSPAPSPTTTTTGTTTTTPPARSPDDSLSPGNQKIARALCEAQTTGTTTTSTAPKTLTLDEIAAMKQSGRGWGNVFKDMKAQGLVQDKNLGQVVSRYSQRRPSQGSVTTAAGREYRYEGRDGRHGWKGEAPDDGVSASRGPGRSESRYESRGSDHGRSGTYTAGGGSGGSDSGSMAGSSGRGSGGPGRRGPK